MRYYILSLDSLPSVSLSCHLIPSPPLSSPPLSSPPLVSFPPHHLSYHCIAHKTEQLQPSKYHPTPDSTTPHLLKNSFLIFSTPPLKLPTRTFALTLSINSPYPRYQYTNSHPPFFTHYPEPSTTHPFPF